MSEWGNPAGVMPGHPLAEYIGLGKRTEGTETSKYLEEEKTTVIPLVAASERGRAQTARVEDGSRCPSGVVGAVRRDLPVSRVCSIVQVEAGWKAAP
jgi:hypothetical protein